MPDNLKERFEKKLVVTRTGVDEKKLLLTEELMKHIDISTFSPGNIGGLYLGKKDQLEWHVACRELSMENDFLLYMIKETTGEPQLAIDMSKLAVTFK